MVYQPKNAVEIALLLLDAGAEIDAEAAMYGGSTTLGLIATSAHPAHAGVQEALIEAFLARGATVDGGFTETNHVGYTRGAVVGCLANGRGPSAELLARRGARLDLEGAAGVGRLDIVKSFFNEAGQLTAGATEAQLHAGFQWACEFGKTDVVKFLLTHGVDVGIKHRGQTALHWAAYAAQPDIAALLLRRKAPLEVKDDHHDGTPLDWALYGWRNPPLETKPENYYAVVAQLITAGAVINRDWLPVEKIATDPRMQAALGLVGQRTV